MESNDLILGTAGIDHGKTSLIRALTGVDTDRLPEEQKRGITIELGFAHLEVPPHRFGVVDVPGHERFVRNMLRRTGMDAVLLVVAADDSIKQQTREHLEILKLLRLPCGVIAATKCDLVDEDWLDLVEEFETWSPGPVLLMRYCADQCSHREWPRRTQTGTQVRGSNRHSISK